MFNIGGELVREILLNKDQFGADRILYHRQDLQSSLQSAAVSPDLPGNPAVIRTSSQVVDVDCEEGIVTLEGGEKVGGDIIIGADGIHSAVRTAVLGEERKAIPTGISAYRMLIPTEKLENLSAPKKLLDPLDPSTTMLIGHDRRVIMGPGRGAKMYGIVALVPDEKLAETSSSESWVESGSIEKLRSAYSDFPDWLHEIFMVAPDIALWQLRDIDPLPRWVRGRAILIGDAAHAMLPTQGQGASQSIEDAEALGAFLGVSTAKEDVQKALERVFAVRRERASLIQKYSREQAKPATDGKSNEIKLDPGQFMKYNCNYEGAADWEERQRRGEVEV
jgi:salicylate hydroxylase